MKRIKNFALFAFVAFTFASCGEQNGKKNRILGQLKAGEIPEEVTHAAIDVNLSEIIWEGQKITGASHYGTIGIKKGVLYVFDDKLWGGEIIIDMHQIVVLDIVDAEMNARLKGHLESDDFFSVADYPEARFHITNFEAIEEAVESEPNYLISGNLTIKEITHKLIFPAIIHISENTISGTADLGFDRTIYNIRFGSGRFFDNLGDNLIRDKIRLSINLIVNY